MSSSAATRRRLASIPMFTLFSSVAWCCLFVSGLGSNYYLLALVITECVLVSLESLATICTAAAAREDWASPELEARLGSIGLSDSHLHTHTHTLTI